jgi:hypothetical protein
MTPITPILWCRLIPNSCLVRPVLERPSAGTLGRRRVPSGLMSGRPSVTCIGWKVYQNGQSVVDKTGCRSWWSRIVVDHRNWGRVRGSRCGSSYRHNLQLFASDSGAERAISRRCPGVRRVASGTSLATVIPRCAGGSASEDAPVAAGGSGSAVPRSRPAGREHLQQLLSGPAMRAELDRAPPYRRVTRN